MKKILETRSGVILAYDPGKKTRVYAGKISRTRTTFIKKVRQDLHFYREKGGYAIQESVIEYLADVGITYVNIIETDTGIIRRSKFRQWLEKGEIMNKGYGRQRCLRVKYMERKIKGYLL